MGFSLKKVKLNVFCKVIDKDNIVFEIIKQMNRKGPHIRKYYFKRLRRNN